MPNRYLCSALEEMRDQLRLLDYSNIDKYRSVTSMLIEEVQSMANRMEAAIRDTSQYEDLIEKRRKLKQQIKRLEHRKVLLEEELDELEDDSEEDEDAECDEIYDGLRRYVK